MQSVIKHVGKNNIGLGWTAGGAVLIILAATIGWLLMVNSDRLNTPPPALVSNGQPAPAREQTLADIMSSGQYPFGASGFDSLLPAKPATSLADIVSSGHYPFGASGFDSLLPAKPATRVADIVSSGRYPFGASGFDSLLPAKAAATPAELIGSGHYPFGASGFDSLLGKVR
jgi:hypothetical protein